MCKRNNFYPSDDNPRQLEKLFLIKATRVLLYRVHCTSLEQCARKENECGRYFSACVRKMLFVLDSYMNTRKTWKCITHLRRSFPLILLCYAEANYKEKRVESRVQGEVKYWIVCVCVIQLRYLMYYSE